MAEPNANIDPTSTHKREVTISIHVDGVPYIHEAFSIEEFAIPFVASAAVVQLDDPDYEGAIDQARDAGEPLPSKW